MTTAMALLERGEAVVIFPEGTRTRPVARPAQARRRPPGPRERRARRAVAVIGSERARRGWRIRPVKVRIRFGRPLTFPRWRTLAVPGRRGHRAHLAVRRASVGVARRLAALRRRRWSEPAPGHGAVAVLARAGLEVQLGCRTAEQAERLMATERENAAYLPAWRWTARSRSRRCRHRVRRAWTSSARGALREPARRGGRARDPGGRSRGGARASKGLVRHSGTTLRLRVRACPRASGGRARRARARARGDRAGRLGGGGHSRRRPAPPAARCARAGGLTADATDDVTGAELAACAKNAAALAAAAAVPRANLAGAAAGRVFSEVHAWRWRAAVAARRLPGSPVRAISWPQSMAEGSRNRRAGELVGGPSRPARSRRPWIRPPSRWPPCRCWASRSARGHRRSGATGLGQVLDGAPAPSQWLESVHSARAAGARAAPA